MIDNAREGRSRTACILALMQKVENKINEDCYEMLRDVLSSVRMSHISVHTILKHDLHMNKVSHMVPRVLMEEQKETRSNLHRLARGDDIFFRVVTGDESWVYKYELAKN